MIVWWVDLQLHVYKDENKLGAVEGRGRMVVRFTTTYIYRREQVRDRRKPGSYGGWIYNYMYIKTRTS